MTCSESPDIYFEFRDDDNETYLTIHPRSMQFDRSRGDFDYCQAEFAQEVADVFQPELDKDESPLLHPVPVVVFLDGNEIYRMLYTPDSVTFGENNVHIEFHDPQKYLTSGTISWRRENVKLREAYEYVFSQRNTSGAQVFSDIKFTDGTGGYEELRTRFRDGPLGLNLRNQETDDLIEEERDEEAGKYGALGERDVIRKLEEENVYNIIDGHYVLDYDKVTPWEAILDLNEKFGVQTWAEPDGNLWVGSRSVTGNEHLTAPDDRRVWKLSNYNIPTPRDPVVKSVVRGGWVDDPSEDWIDQGTELAAMNKGTKDFRVEAVATSKTSSPLGLKIEEEQPDTKRDALEGIAKQKMQNKRRDQQSGYLEILPEISGSEVSDISYVRVGDSVATIPPDGDADEGSLCDSNIEKEKFHIVGVQHELAADSSWNVRLDVVKHLDGELAMENIETELQYYNPSTDETIDSADYSEMVEEDEEDFWPDFI